MYESDSRADRLAAALDEFIRSSPDVEAAAVVSFDGLPMASALPAELEEDRVGAMSAALLSLGEQAAMGLGRGLLNQVFVEGEHGFVFLMSARDQAVLTAIAGRNAKIGFMLFEMRRAADRIGRALESGQPAVVAPEASAPADQGPRPLPSDLPGRDDADGGSDASDGPDAPDATDVPEASDAPEGDQAPVDLPPPAESSMFDQQTHHRPSGDDDGEDHEFFQPPRSAASE